MQYSPSDGNLTMIRSGKEINRRMRIAKKETAPREAISPKLLNNIFFHTQVAQVALSTQVASRVSVYVLS